MKIKKFNESWKDIFSDNKEEKKKEYLSQFKKPYEDRNKAEKIVVESLYFIEFEGSQDNRFYGAIESILVLNDYLTGGKPFDFKEIEKKGIFGKFKTKEGYRDLILRLGRDFLSKSGVISPIDHRSGNINMKIGDTIKIVNQPEITKKIQQFPELKDKVKYGGTYKISKVWTNAIPETLYGLEPAPDCGFTENELKLLELSVHFEPR